MIVLYCHQLIHAEIYIYILDTYRRNDNRGMIKDRRTNKGHRKTSLTTYLPLNLLQGFDRVVQGFACERVVETEHKLHILTSTTYDRHVVSFLFSWCSTGGQGLTLLDAGFLYGILSATSLDPKLHRGFRGPPRSGVAFPTTSGL